MRATSRLPPQHDHSTNQAILLDCARPHAQSNLPSSRSLPISYMQQESPERSEQNNTSNHPSTSSSPNQYGSLSYEHQSLYRVHSGGSSSVSSQSTRRDSDDGIDAAQLDERLRGLSLRAIKALRHPAPGQRISDYENALTPPTPRQALGFKVIKRSGGDAGDGVQLTDIPNGQFSSRGDPLRLDLFRMPKMNVTTDMML